MSFFIEIEMSILTFIRKHKSLQIAKTSLIQNSNTGGITTPDFKLYYRDIVIKTGVVLAQKQT
jgi:hypothetical protein